QSGHRPGLPGDAPGAGPAVALGLRGPGPGGAQQRAGGPAPGRPHLDALGGFKSSPAPNLPPRRGGSYSQESFTAAGAISVGDLAAAGPALELASPGGPGPAVVRRRAMALSGIFSLFHPGAAFRALPDPGLPPGARLLLRAGVAGPAAPLELPPALGLAPPPAGPGPGLSADLGRGGGGLLFPFPGEAGPLHFTGAAAPGPAPGAGSGGPGGRRPGRAERSGFPRQPLGLGCRGGAPVFPALL